MWIVAGALLGLVVLSSILGFHVGPHGHVVASVVGVVAAMWLIGMAASGHGEPLLWTLLSADVVASAGIGTVAYKGLTSARALAGAPSRSRLIGADGVALSELSPDGIVQVNGEQWSARSLNGRVAKGGTVQVVSDKGVRLEVWGAAPLGAEEAPVRFSLEPPSESELRAPAGAPPVAGEDSPPPNEQKASAS